jgi:hypothetical protein
MRVATLARGGREREPEARLTDFPALPLPKLPALPKLQVRPDTAFRARGAPRASTPAAPRDSTGALFDSGGGLRLWPPGGARTAADSTS